MKRKFIFEWNPEELSIRVDAMDRDHQKLIQLMNQIYMLHTKHGARNEIQKVLQQLGAFVFEHFRREEKFMETIPGYLDLDIHKAIHRKLENRYGFYVKKFEEGAELDDDFFFFLKAWLVAHIEGVDMKYGNIVSQAS